jgi:WD40 repeat protein
LRRSGISARAKQIGVPLTGPSSWAVAALDPTGHTLATAFQDGTVLLWDPDPAPWLKRACAVAGRRLTLEEWQEFLPGRPLSALLWKPLRSPAGSPGRSWVSGRFLVTGGAQPMGPPALEQRGTLSVRRGIPFALRFADPTVGGQSHGAHQAQ